MSKETWRVCRWLSVVVMVLLAGCSDGSSQGDDDVTPDSSHPTTSAVDEVADVIRPALEGLEVTDSGAVTTECPSGMGDFGSGTFSTTRELRAQTNVDPSVLDAVVAALDRGRVVSDRALTNPITGDSSGRAVDLAVQRAGMTISVAGVVEDGSLYIGVESDCV